MGKTIIDKRRPPRLTPKVIDAAKEPITDRAGVPASRDKIIQIIEFIGTPQTSPTTGVKKISGKQVVIQCAKDLTKTIPSNGNGEIDNCSNVPS